LGKCHSYELNGSVGTSERNLFYLGGLFWLGTVMRDIDALIHTVVVDIVVIIFVTVVVTFKVLAREKERKAFC